jgi:hypothetical protein
MPGSKFSVVLSAKLLKPIAFRLFKYIGTSLCLVERNAGNLKPTR